MIVCGWKMLHTTQHIADQMKDKIYPYVFNVEEICMPNINCNKIGRNKSIPINIKNAMDSPSPADDPPPDEVALSSYLT
jgi:hypothetical protein